MSNIWTYFNPIRLILYEPSHSKNRRMAGGKKGKRNALAVEQNFEWPIMRDKPVRADANGQPLHRVSAREKVDGRIPVRH